MEHQYREVITVIVLLGMAAALGLVISFFEEGTATGASILDGVACSANIDCDDHVQCTIDSCKNPGEDNAFCSNTPIDYCLSDDGCCPRGCTTANDNDC